MPDPPPLDAAGDNLRAPEVAPPPEKEPDAPAQDDPSAAFAAIDGRSLRATGRTHQFATRIKIETHNDMKRLASRDRISMAELIERALDSYKKATS